MPSDEQRKLKLIKGARSGLPGNTRPLTRRMVTRRLPPTENSVTTLLSRLDEEPVQPDDPVDRGTAAPGTGHSGTEAPDVGTSNAETPGTETPAPEAADTETPGTENSDIDGESADDPGRSADSGDGPARSMETGRTSHTEAADGGRRRVGSLLLIVVCGVALAAAGLFGHRWYTAHALAEAHQQAVAAARQTTVNFVSVSASSVDRDLQRIVEGATGEFKEEFTRGMAQVRAAVVENKVESTGSVLRAGLVSGDLRNATVLVAVDATVKNSHAPEGRASHYRIQVDLAKDRQSGAWLVSRLQFVG